VFLFINIHSHDLSPLDVIKQSNQKVLDIFKVQKTLDEKTEARLLEIINGVTDFEAISHAVTERFCQQLSETQCQIFDGLFQRLLQVSSLKKLGRYRANRFEYLGEEVNENQAIVKTIAYYKEESAELNYYMKLKNGRWMIVNYVVDDIDTIRNYKKQFLRLFAKKNFEQIMDRLRKKIDDYEEKNRQ
jgi:ABC-type transporter MlaC component